MARSLAASAPFEKLCCYVCRLLKEGKRSTQSPSLRIAAVGSQSITTTLSVAACGWHLVAVT
jgi:hypothetical protein